MIVNGIKTLIVRCQSCGKLMEYDFNVFKFIVEKEVEYKCKCGEKITVLNKDNNVNLGIKCFEYENIYNYNLELESIINDDYIYCSYKPNNYPEPINVKENNFENTFEPYSKIVERLFDLNRKKSLSCDCKDPKLDMDFFHDRIEIKCLTCHSVIIIFAETEEDLSVLLKRDKIILKEHNISFIDSMSEIK